MVEFHILSKRISALTDLMILNQHYLAFKVIAKDHVDSGLTLMVGILLDKEMLADTVEIVGLTYENSLGELNILCIFGLIFEARKGCPFDLLVRKA